MGKFNVIYHWSDGSQDEEDELYDSYEEAQEAGFYGLSGRELGAEILNMSNPGDYPIDGEDFDNDDFEIVEL